MAAATASLACLAASSIALWDGGGLEGFVVEAPFVAASAGAATGGVNAFWLTVNGTAGVTRLFLGPVGTFFGCGSAGPVGGGCFAATWANVCCDCGCGCGCCDGFGLLVGGAGVLVLLGALLSPCNSEV
jgi:hypothetical protein